MKKVKISGVEKKQRFQSSITKAQKNKLSRLAKEASKIEKVGISEAEINRRAIDAYLA